MLFFDDEDRNIEAVRSLPYELFLLYFHAYNVMGG